MRIKNANFLFNMDRNLSLLYVVVGERSSAPTGNHVHDENRMDINYALPRIHRNLAIPP